MSAMSAMSGPPVKKPCRPHPVVSKVTEKVISEFTKKELVELRAVYQRDTKAYTKKLKKHGKFMLDSSKPVIQGALAIPVDEYIKYVARAKHITKVHDELYREAEKNQQPTGWCKGKGSFYPIKIFAESFFNGPLDTPSLASIHSCKRAIDIWMAEKAANTDFEWLKKPEFGELFRFIITQLQTSVIALERGERPHPSIGSVKIPNITQFLDDAEEEQD